MKSMKKQVIFSFLFLSWISGISLTCLFPPVPDYQSSERNSSFLSIDASPEMHQILNPSFGVSFGELGINISDFVQKDFFILNRAFDLLIESICKSAEICSLFDSRILLAPFFETW
jgi:hypothetical protein